MDRDVAPLPGYREPYGLLCAILQDATNDWRKMELWHEDLPAEAMTWRIAPGMHSMGAVILHMASVEIYWLEEFVLRRQADPEEVRLLLRAETDVDNNQWPDAPSQPLRWYYELHDRLRARTLESVKEWPGPEERIPMHDFTITPRWVLGHVIQHESYHGGQILMLHDLWKAQQG
ncbi:MAG: DinB family protein [Fimbriimonadaceae bacterium]|nr:DinB family protein [Fimbriimonadaceae bacterium]QYK55535.1 MAG: DinB family protein [Fimbriimonadaceae bacterium]